VRALLADLIGQDQVDSARTTESLSDLGLDSIALISLVIQIEEVTGRELSTGEIAALADVGPSDLEGLVAGWVNDGTSGAGPELPEAIPGRRLRLAEPTPVIRKYRSSDRADLAQLCRSTCTRPWLQGVAHLLWLYPYLDREPEACLVAERYGSIVAYWVGTSSELGLARGFGGHVRRYLRDWVRLYPTILARTLSARKHLWYWSVVLGALVNPKWAFRRYNRRDELGPILGTTKVHFQVSPDHSSTGVVFAFAQNWLDYLRSTDVDLACLPGIPGADHDEAGALSYWRRAGYNPVRFHNWTILVAFVDRSRVGS
jgi:acyl carrier protein